MDGASLVALGCLVAGLVLVAVGVFVGLTKHLSSMAASQEQFEQARATLEQARAAVERTSAELARAQAAMANPTGLEADGGAGAVIEDATASAAASTDRAKSAIEQVGGIVASLPEDLRFAGLLVLVGTVLTSVATIQFGGTSLF